MSDLDQWLDLGRGAEPAARGGAGQRVVGELAPDDRRSRRAGLVPSQVADSRPTPRVGPVSTAAPSVGPVLVGAGAQEHRGDGARLRVPPSAGGLPESMGAGADPAALAKLPLPSAPTLLCDQSDRVVRVNAALLRMAGRDPRQPKADENILGRPLSQLVIGPDHDARLVRPDGALARVRVVRWDLRELLPGGVRAVMLVDAAEASPEVSGRDDVGWQLAQLQRLAKAGTWTYDLRTGALYRAPSLAALYRELGIEPDAEGSGPIELEQVAALCAALRENQTGSATGANDDGGDSAAAAAKPVETHYREHHTGAPHERVLGCRANVERNAEGTPVRLVGTVQDITDRWLAEQRIGRATRRYLDLVSIAPVGVGVFNRAGRLVDANGALCFLLGLPGERLRGVSVRSLSVDPTGPDDLAFLRPARPGEPTSYRIPQYAIRRADGTTVWCELAVTVSIGDDGRPFWLVVFTDITERRRAADVLRIAGTHDELTRLPNRASVTERVGRALAGPDRHKLAVLCCDLDDFKRVNTALGHAAGDQVLIMLAARLQRELPVGCTAARLSGDEFVVVCDDVFAVGGLAKLAELVAALLRAPVEVDGQAVRVSAAIGAATPADDIASVRGVPTAEDLLRFADAAMYDAKQRGAGQLALLTAEAASNANNQLRLEDELREAIATDQLVLHYQPVVGPDGAVRSAEALIRWQHPERGLLFPGDFVPVAERGGLMRELDRWVLRTATREAATWPAHNRRPVSVAVNLAGLLPGDRDFVATIRSALADSGLAGDRLVLELVETCLVSLPEHTLAAMSELAGLGIRFAVDDFGTGYSSLSRIKELPAQIVKVDRSFVSGISTDPADFAVARAVVQMAAAMGRYCVAEGVETADQFHALRGLGVDAYQGWLFAKAMNADEFRALLAGPPLRTPPGEPGPPPDGLSTQALRPEAARRAQRRAAEQVTKVDVLASAQPPCKPVRSHRAEAGAHFGPGFGASAPRH